MNKLRCDSKWNALKQDQRETLHAWLFEENLGYQVIVERVQKEFGLTVSLVCVQRYYQYAAAQRMQEELKDVVQITEDVKATHLDSDDFTEAAMTLVAKRMIQVAVHQPQKVKLLATLARTLIAHRSANIKNSWLEIGQERALAEEQERQREKGAPKEPEREHGPSR